MIRPAAASYRRRVRAATSGMPYSGFLLLALVAAVALVGPWLSPFDAQAVGVGPTMSPPGTIHWMGTDDLGRDVLRRVVTGTRISLAMGVAAAFTAVILGVVVGSVAGYFGGFIDDLLMRVTEAVQIIPRFFLALVLVAIFGATSLNIVLAIALLSWPVVARITRAEFLTLKSRAFVDAARLAGASDATILFAEILPNALGPVIVVAAIQIGQAILLEAGLSYLGLGDPNAVSLGLMLFQAQSVFRLAWWTAVFPGLMITFAVLGCNLVGDALSRMLDPRWQAQ